MVLGVDEGLSLNTVVHPEVIHAALLETKSVVDWFSLGNQIQCSSLIANTSEHTSFGYSERLLVPLHCTAYRSSWTWWSVFCMVGLAHH